RVREVGGGRSDGQAGVRAPDGAAEGVRLQVAGLLVRGPAAGVEPADGGRGEVALGAWPGAHRVQGGDGVAGADLAAVDPVVAEVLVGDPAVVVADEPELGDRLRVEGDLGLGVPGGQLDVAGQVLAEHRAGLLLVGDVDGVAVALVREALHQRVAVDRKSTRLNSSHVKISYAV